ncbi:MAG: dehalogenase [Symbiobacteriaceae bacterium]|jgi:threonine/homoserine/homoserine lactone efflux protein|nr:dehalogenase [Symbiobacteriaceae bacterium]
MLWMLIGLVAGLGVTLLVQFLNKHNIKLRWYEWLLVGAGLLLILFNVDTYINSLAELEPKAANLSLLFLGLPGLVLLVLGVRLGYSRKGGQPKTTSKAA